MKIKIGTCKKSDRSVNEASKKRKLEQRNVKINDLQICELMKYLK